MAESQEGFLYHLGGATYPSAAGFDDQLRADMCGFALWDAGTISVPTLTFSDYQLYIQGGVYPPTTSIDDQGLWFLGGVVQPDPEPSTWNTSLMYFLGADEIHADTAILTNDLFSMAAVAPVNDDEQTVIERFDLNYTLTPTSELLLANTGLIDAVMNSIASNLVGSFPIVTGGGFASGNSIDSYLQRKKKRKKELAKMLRELYDMSPDP